MVDPSATPSAAGATRGHGAPRVLLLSASWALLAATGALATTAAVLPSEAATVPAAAYEALVYVAVGGLGVAVTRRRPANPVGWLLQLVAVALAVNAVGTDVVLRSAAVGGTPGGLVPAAAWCTNWVWIAAIVPAFTLFPLLFPTGRPPSPAWGVLLRVALLAAAATWLGAAFAPGRLDSAPHVRNPVGIDHPAVEVVGWVGFAVLLPSTIGAIASLVLRFRRAEGVERQQLKWVAAAAALLPFGFVALGLRDDETGFLLLLTALLLVALAVAVAMLRYRLYDLDVVVNRALVYGSLTVLLAASYVAGVLLLQLALQPLTRSSDLAVAGSTLAVAALFRPARAHVRALVDRRFYRSRYDAARTLSTFTAQLRDQLDADALVTDVCRVVDDTVHPVHVSLWVPTPDRGAP